MDSKAQASVEYLFAIVLSFFFTLIVLSSMIGFAGSTKESIICKLNNCTASQASQEAKNPISTNVLVFTVTLVVFYFVEFFFVVLFLRYIGKPEKKKLPKKTNY